MDRSQVTFLMTIAKLDGSSIQEYERAFGSPSYVINAETPLNQINISFRDVVTERMEPGGKMYLFWAKTIPHKYFIVCTDETGRVSSRTWISM